MEQREKIDRKVAWRLALAALLACCLLQSSPAQVAFGSESLLAATQEKAGEAASGPDGNDADDAPSTVKVYRMEHPTTHAQRLVASDEARKKLLKSRWRCVGIAFEAPVRSDVPVYEFSNKKTGMRFYTTNPKERKRYAKNKKWKSLGIAFYASSSGTPVYRLYNKKTQSRTYVTGTAEKRKLVKAGYKYEKVAWRAEAAGRSLDWVATLKVARKTNQLIVVEASGTHANVSMHVKSNGTWRQVTTTKKGWVGGSGLGKAREGVDYTPRGVLKPDRAFGIKRNPGCKMGYLKVNKTHYWCGDSYSRLYNKLVSTKKHNNFNKAVSEHLASMGKAYNYCLNMGYNASCKPHGGSAFFLHCSTGRPTGGCVSVPQKTMKKILRTIEPGCRIVIDTAKGVMRY